ncbi:hypothetical protein STEG23_013101 [Scotinomys teguina]
MYVPGAAAAAKPGLASSALLSMEAAAAAATTAAPSPPPAVTRLWLPSPIKSAPPGSCYSRLLQFLSSSHCYHHNQKAETIGITTRMASQSLNIDENADMCMVQREKDVESEVLPTRHSA